VKKLAKLVLYSDQVIGKTEKIDEELLRLIGKRNPRVGYIPSCSDVTRKYYNQKVQYYGRMGINDLMYFDLDREYDENRMKDMFECDAIHLSGGDTSYFLSNINKRKFDTRLKEYVNNGGVLIGISAGAIIMSEAIDIVNVMEESFDSSQDTSGLGLVDFDICPHWDRGIYDINIYADYSKRKNKLVYLCSDGDGIIIDGERRQLIGNIIKIEMGHIIC
jgi:dipeptidase E